MFVRMARRVNENNKIFASPSDQARQASSFAHFFNVVPNLKNLHRLSNEKFTLAVELAARLVVSKFDELTAL